MSPSGFEISDDKFARKSFAVLPGLPKPISQWSKSLKLSKDSSSPLVEILIKLMRLNQIDRLLAPSESENLEFLNSNFVAMYMLFILTCVNCASRRSSVVGHQWWLIIPRSKLVRVTPIFVKNFYLLPTLIAFNCYQKQPASSMKFKIYGILFSISMGTILFVQQIDLKL